MNKNNEYLIEQYSKPIPVGHSGFVRLIDLMGSDSDIAAAARVSYNNADKPTSEAQDVNLIRYLMRHKHTSPIEMCEIKLHLKAPIHLFRQLIRHRTASVNEVSTRYTEIKDEFEMITPEELRLQSTSNKQGSSGLFIEESSFVTANMITEEFYNSAIEQSYGAYKYMIDKGIAREQARNVLPLATYSEMYWKIDLKNLLHFLKLRLDSHAQKEIRDLAEAIAVIVRNWVPHTWQAFIDYEKESLNLSRMEKDIFKTIMAKPENQTLLKQLLEEDTTMSKREKTELLDKLDIL